MRLKWRIKFLSMHKMKAYGNIEYLRDYEYDSGKSLTATL